MKQHNPFFLGKVGKGYDIKKRRFTSYLVPIVIFSLIMITSFFFGIFLGIPAIFYISFFALGVSLVALLHDHWLLNSIVVPMVFIFAVITIHDGFSLEFLRMIMHLSITVMAFIVGLRTNTGLFVSILASAGYAIWIYSIQQWLPLPVYTTVFWVSDPFWQSMSVFIGGSIISGVVTAKNFIMKKIFSVKIDCDGGICPL